MKLNKFEEAIIDFTKTIEIDPRNIIAYLDRGINYSHLVGSA